MSNKNYSDAFNTGQSMPLYESLSESASLTEAERNRVLYEWNATAKDYPAVASAVELFEAQVERTPEAVAVVFGEQQVSYRELNERVNQLAHYLREQGVVPDEPVGILMDRSVEMLVALLGALKAGAGYLPLDPQYPSERLLFMVEDVGARLVLTQRKYRALPFGQSVRVVEIGSETASLRQQPRENPPLEAGANNLAYVIYTSGSTGKPKGVGIEHHSLITLLFWARDTFSLEELAKVPALTSISFDISVFEIFVPLCWGGAIVLVENALSLGAAPNAHEITLINTVPSVMAEMVRLGVPASVRTIILAGELLKGSLVRQIYEHTGISRLLNLYGPTEDTVFSTYTDVPRGTVKSPSIGRPFPNTQVYILNDALEPVPVGEPGECYLGGDGLARGYLNHPELTAERFIPNPYALSPGARLYKTGDLVRYLPDGNIEFVGRSDHQLKVRGFRIEPGEVETALETYAGITGSVVVALEHGDNERRLVAYLVSNQSPPPSVGDLRGFLCERLPEYMIPSAFVFLDQIPLTQRGKVNRRALPAPESVRPALSEAFVAPTTLAEEELAAIWADILKLDRVGINDDFFELGGDSLLATQVISRVRLSAQLDVPLHLLFENPTVASLAGRIEEEKAATGRRALPRFDAPASRREQSPLSFSQQGMWVFYRLEPESNVHNIPLVMRLDGRLDRAALEQSLSEILRRHEILSATFTNVEGETVQKFTPTPATALQTVSLRDMPRREREAELQRLIDEETRRLFDLSHGPLLRTTLLQLSEHEHVLLVSIHHIVSDGWSLDIFIRELATLYEAFLQQKPSPLKELVFQFADFALFQREWMQGPTLARLLEYWRAQLSGAIPTLDLPSSRPRPSVQTRRGAIHTQELREGLTGELKRLARRENATLFMTMLAAFKALLHRYTGQEDICVGSPIAGRHWMDTEDVIGPFLNTLALRTDLSGNPTFQELLRRVRETTLGAYEHQDMPFELLLEELSVERDLSHTPLFQVMFNMLSHESHRLDVRLPELRINSFEVLNHGAQFDLTLYVQERHDTLQLSAVYNTDLFDESLIASMLEHYRTLLEGIASRPDNVLSKLPLLSKGELMQVSTGSNVVRPDTPFLEFKREEIEQSIVRRFEQQVERHPQNLAVKTGAHEWTYRELNRLANQVARAALHRNGEREERIALLFKHDAPMIAAMLGVLKAGKTYVPLDTAYPQERLAYMLENSQASAILTGGDNLDLARKLAGEKVSVINIENIEERLVTPSDDNVRVNVPPETLAYILYTSGSTGEPKGVMQSHRNVLHHIRCYTNGLHINAEDRLTLLSSYSFDASVMDIYGALLNGAALYPIDLREEGFTHLAGRMIREGITIYHSTPTVYRHFARGLDGSHAFPHLRLVVLGGEEVVRPDVELYRERFTSQCLFVNGFGPTESTVSLQYFLDKNTEVSRNTVPVGYAVENTEVLILDETGERVPPYVVGEIAIRSEHVALGYWRQEELTRRAFVPDPSEPRKRIYRTGDMGRALADGSIEFRGRKDSQVKLRGYRIELSEIEAALRQNPAVREAVVVLVREDASSDAKLEAFVVPNPETHATASEIRAYLKGKLPEYMLPSMITMVEELRLTSNGKLERRALSSLQRREAEPEETHAAPRTPEEKIIADIWSQVLQVDRVGIHDNFLDLGGDSLTVALLIARLRDSFSIELSVRAVFERATVAEQAELVSSSRK